jgi:uncharacterized membrane protein YfhO
MEVFNMLNTRYIVIANDKGEKSVEVNGSANGNVWLVNNLKVVETENAEMVAMDSLQTKNEAVINAKNISSDFITNYPIDAAASIKLQSYKANELVYESSSSLNQFAVFSEIYYKDGWNAYVDGRLTPHYNVNYVLRGMEIPKGKHTIEFKFEPTVIKKGNTITLVSYFLLLLIPLGWFFIEKKKRNVQ